MEISWENIKELIAFYDLINFFLNSLALNSWLHLYNLIKCIIIMPLFAKDDNLESDDML